MKRKNFNNFLSKSARLQNWNYAWTGYYFITIITKDREYYFGDISDGKMLLSDIGKIVKSEWLKTPEIRPDMNLSLDEYVIMPNHFHGILQIGKNQYNEFVSSNDAMHRVITAETQLTTEIGANPNQKTKSLLEQNQFGPQRKNLASAIRGFKSAVTSNARKIGLEFCWHPRFHENIIRDKKTLGNIRKYIKENPENWSKDELNSLSE